MKLATIRTNDGTRAVRLDDESLIEIGPGDVGDLLAQRDWREQARLASGPSHDIAGADFAPLVPKPEKVICVGKNYQDHVAELGGGPAPEFPTLFPKYARTLIGANDPIVLPPESNNADWEAELGIVIGTHVRRANEAEAVAAVAGFTVINDISMRDYQRNTSQFTAGKIWEATTPVGPWLEVVEGVDRTSVEPTLEISCTVDGDVRQLANTGEMIFGVVELVRYISTIITLVPGDLIATGTPSGVGAGRTPPVFLQPGQTVVTSIDGVGECRNATMSG